MEAKRLAMKGYIAIVTRNGENVYHAEVLDIPGCRAKGETLDEALHGARQSLYRAAESGVDLPSPRPSHHMIAAVEERSAVAGACLAPLRTAA